MRETGRGLWSDTLGLGLFPLLFPLLSLYLGHRQTDGQTGFPFTLSATAAAMRRVWRVGSHQGPQLTEGRLVLSFSWEVEPSNRTEGTRW